MLGVQPQEPTDTRSTAKPTSDNNASARSTRSAASGGADRPCISGGMSCLASLASFRLSLALSTGLTSPLTPFDPPPPTLVSEGSGR